MRHLRLITAVAGLMLLIVNITGVLRPPIERSEPPQSKPIAGRHYRSQEVSIALREFQTLKAAPGTPEERARSLFRLVSDSFLHAPSYRVEIWDNWFLWLRGLSDNSFHFSQDADLLWRRGGGFCVQASMVYVAKAKELGLEARILLLTGHAVAEVEIPGKGSRVVDPDLKIFWDHSLDAFGRELSAGAIKETLIALGYTEEYATHITEVYTTQDNNTRAQYPMDEVRLEFEERSKTLQWLVPIALIILSGVLYFTGRA